MKKSGKMKRPKNPASGPGGYRQNMKPATPKRNSKKGGK